MVLNTLHSKHSIIAYIFNQVSYLNLIANTLHMK